MRVSVGGVRLYFEVFGEEYAISPDATSIVRRPSLIGLHGGPGGDGGRLRFLLPQLADLAQVVVPDQRGHGRSEAGEPETWNLKQWAADVKEFSDALGIQHPIVLGESFGGFVAQQYAGTYPEHPCALILVCCGSRFATEAETAEQIGGSRGVEVAALINRRANPENTVEEAVADWKRVVDPLLAVRHDPVLDRVERLRISTLEVNRHFEAEGFSMDLRPLLSRLLCPTLIIVGEHDPLVPAPLRNELREAIPPELCRLEVVPSASHRVLTDNPSYCWRLLHDFIAGLD